VRQFTLVRCEAIYFSMMQDNSLRQQKINRQTDNILIDIQSRQTDNILIDRQSIQTDNILIERQSRQTDNIF